MSQPDASRLDRLEEENQRLRRAVQELSLLNDLAREIGASVDTEEIVHRIVRRALKSVQAEQGLLTLVTNQEGDATTTLVRTAGSSAGEAAGQDDYHLNESLLGWMLLHKAPLRLDEPATDPRFQHSVWEVSVRSLLSVPLLIRSRLIGILTVYNKRSGGGFTDGDQRLLAIIAAQSAQIVENARLVEEEKALLGVREELRLAREIQTSLLPTAAPDVPGYAVAGLSRPAQSVGGDFFDYLPLDEGCFGLCVGDVSGKGLPASLLMATVQAMLRGQALGAASPGACLEGVNRLLTPRIRKGTFVTLFYAVLDPRRHTLGYANAGHNRPLLRRADGTVSVVNLGGLVLGFLAQQTYDEAALTLAPGDAVLLYSDGVTEAMNARREQFGDDALLALMQQHGHEAPAALLDRLVHAVERHTDGAPPSDDLTLVVLQRTASPA